MALKKRFRTALFGYRKEDVNQFLLEFNGSYEQMEEYYRDAMRTQAALLTRCDEEKKAMAEKLAESDALRRQVATLESERESYRVQAEEAERLRETVAEKEAAYAGLQESFDETVAAARSGMDDAQCVISAQSEKIAGLEEALEEAKCEVARWKNEAESVKAQLETAKAEAEKREAEPLSMPEIPDAEGEAVLTAAQKQAAEIIAKAKQTAQLIRISALRGEPTPKPEGKATSAALAPEDIQKGLEAMYGEKTTE